MKVASIPWDVGGLSMPASYASPLDTAARGWLSLVERRKAYLIDLFESGRWTHYFTEAELLDELRVVNLARDRFASVARLEPREAAPSAR